MDGELSSLARFPVESGKCKLADAQGCVNHSRLDVVQEMTVEP